MGSVFGSLGGACATLCACEACKSCLSLGKRSARMFYCLLFFLTMLIAWIMRDYSSKLMSEIPWYAPRTPRRLYAPLGLLTPSVTGYRVD
eukprot:scaffold1124_cov361-Prasinococcus_capsulatus_cf.AAC.28